MVDDRGAKGYSVVGFPVCWHSKLPAAAAAEGVLT